MVLPVVELLSLSMLFLSRFTVLNADARHRERGAINLSALGEEAQAIMPLMASNVKLVAFELVSATAAKKRVRSVPYCFVPGDGGKAASTASGDGVDVLF